MSKNYLNQKWSETVDKYIAEGRTVSGGDQAADDKEVTFTPEQQAKIDDIVKKAMGRAGAEAKTQAEADRQRATQLEADLKAAQEALKTATPGDKKDAKDDVEKLKAEIAEMQRARVNKDTDFENVKRKLTDQEKSTKAIQEQLIAERKRNLITSVAAQEQFVDTDAIAALTDKNFKWKDEEGRLVVVNDDGTPKLNASYDPMSPEEFFKDFATKKPYMVKSDARTGSGSEGSTRTGLSTGRQVYKVEEIFGKGSNPRLANDLMKKSPDEYKRLKTEAKQRRLIG